MKFKSRICALVLVMVFVLALTPITVSAAETGSIGGTSTVTDVTIEVTLPTSLDFAIDPLELDSIEGSQISDVTYLMVNKTLAPVRVGFEIETTLDTGVTLVSDPTTLKKDDITATEKNLYFGALGASGITAAGNFADDAAGTTAAFDAKKNTLVPFGTDGKVSIAWALSPAKDTNTDKAPDTLADGNKGMAAFQFFGEMNTYAAWKAGDVKVTGKYTLTALRASTFDKLTAADFASDGVNQLKAGSSTSEVGFTDRTGSNSATAATITLSKENGPATLDIGFNFGEKALKEVQFASGSTLAASNYTTGTNKITLAASRVTTLKGGAVGTETVFKVVLNDNTVHTLTIKIVA